MPVYDNLTEKDVIALAKTLAHSIKCPSVICLWGDLGAGKTTFSRAFIRQLSPSTQDVPSPTFTIIQDYTTPVGDLWHCDLYRLTHEEEVEELGLVEAFYDKICLIEWPERLGGYLPRNRVDIKITINTDLTRRIEVS